MLQADEVMKEHQKKGELMKSKKAGFNSIDEYIATFPKKIQKIMKQLRGTIKAAAPEAEEKISYQMPTFTLNGKYLVYFSGFKNHIGFYGAPRGNADFKEDLSVYETGQGTLKFPFDKPMPFGMITKIVEFRVAENLKRTEKKKY